MGCFSKFFLFALNFAVFVIGVGVIVLASLIISSGTQFQTLLDKGTFTVPIVLLILGLIVMLIGFFGCVGAMRESPCLLYTYATIVLLLFLAQVAVVIYGFVNRDDLEMYVSKGMTDIFDKYGGTDLELTNSLDGAQHELKCCGVNNYTDWFNGKIPDSPMQTSGDVPIGCCIHNVTGCNIGIRSKPEVDVMSSIYTQGCFVKLVDVVESKALWLGIGAAVLAIVQLFCVLIACGIGKRSANGSHNVY